MTIFGCMTDCSDKNGKLQPDNANICKKDKCFAPDKVDVKCKVTQGKTTVTQTCTNFYKTQAAGFAQTSVFAFESVS
jgi:hypothetical protein